MGDDLEELFSKLQTRPAEGKVHLLRLKEIIVIRRCPAARERRARSGYDGA